MRLRLLNRLGFQSSCLLGKCCLEDLMPLLIREFLEDHSPLLIREFLHVVLFLGMRRRSE
jgi:hypothetical protein